MSAVRRFLAIALVAAASGCAWTIRVTPSDSLPKVRDADALRAEYARDSKLTYWQWTLHVPEKMPQALYLEAVWSRIAVLERDRVHPIAADADAKSDIEWVQLPGGAFMMGRSADANARPRHKVTIAAFEMSKSLVTVAQYKACVDAGACTEPPRGGQCDWGVPFHERNPVVCVSWAQARRFARWAHARLPTEAEWEYAARSGGGDRAYPWGDDLPTCDQVVGRGRCATRGPVPVCARPAGNTDQGLCDMGGYVQEWTQDVYHDSYAGAPTDGSAWEIPGGYERVVRGGDLRADQRASFFPSTGQFSIGFRLAR